MKKIFSVLLTVALIITCLGTVAFADYTGIATDKPVSFSGYSEITIPADEVDNEFTVSLRMNYPSGFSYIDMIQLNLSVSGVEIVSDTPIAYTSIGMASLTDTVGTTGGTYLYQGSDTAYGMEPSHYATLDNGTISVLTLKRVDNAKTATITFGSGDKISDEVTPATAYTYANMQTLTINFEEEQQQVTYPTLDEETFDAAATVDGVTVKNGSKAWTVFQKTATDLAAESYGVQVVTGGKTYKFPGKVAITLGEATEKIWGIKLIAPENAFKDGTPFAPTSIKAYDPAGEYEELVK